MRARKQHSIKFIPLRPVNGKETFGIGCTECQYHELFEAKTVYDIGFNRKRALKLAIYHLRKDMRDIERERRQYAEQYARISSVLRRAGSLGNRR
jgi:hypothetical protein